MKPGDHSIVFYSKPEDKQSCLFAFLKAGVDRGEAVAYVAGQESPDEIRQAMKQFGLDVDGFEKAGALHVIDYKDLYTIGGRFSVSKAMGLWKKLCDEVKAKGFKGLWVVLEMVFFFENKMVKELVEYEESLHRELEMPFTVVCGYDHNVVANGGGKLVGDLIKAHSSFIFLGQEGGVVKSY